MGIIDNIVERDYIVGIVWIKLRQIKRMGSRVI